MAKGKPRHVLRSAPSLWVSRKSEAMRPRIYDFGPGTRARDVKSMSSRAIEDMWFQIYNFQGPTRKYVLQAAICEGERGHVSSNLWFPRRSDDIYNQIEDFQWGPLTQIPKSQGVDSTGDVTVRDRRGHKHCRCSWNICSEHMFCADPTLEGWKRMSPILWFSRKTRKCVLTSMIFKGNGEHMSSHLCSRGESRTYVLKSMIFKGNRGHMSSNLWFWREIEDICPDFHDFEGKSWTYVLISMILQGNRGHMSSNLWFWREIEDICPNLYDFQGKSRTYVLILIIFKANRGHMSSPLCALYVGT